MRLAPAQRQALDALLAIAKPGCVVGLNADFGTGRTAILREAHATLGGILLGARDLEAAMGGMMATEAISTHVDFVKRAD